jgi:hypothetical protein
MIGATAKPVIPPPGVSSSEYEAAVAAFTHAKGVMRCPTVCMVRTQGSVPAADYAELRRYEVAREMARREKIAATSRLLGFRVAPLPRRSAPDDIGWRRDKSAKKRQHHRHSAAKSSKPSELGAQLSVFNISSIKSLLQEPGQ